MTPLAVSTGIAILAWVGLAVGLIVLIVVIVMLQAVLAPILKIGRDVAEAKDTPMLGDRGIRGIDDLRRTRSLAVTVPNLANAYLAKLGAGAPATPSPTMPGRSPFEKPSYR